MRLAIRLLKSCKILRYLVVREKKFVVGMHLKPGNCSKSLEFFLSVGITGSTVGIAYRQNPRIMTSSKFWLKNSKKI